MRVPALSKPRLTWCQHCEIGSGCGIYAERPPECAAFYCDYRLNAWLGEEWRPATCGMIMTYEPAARRVEIQVDPANGQIWRSAPYYQQIKMIAENALRGQGYLIVWEGSEAIGVLPDREVNLGPVTADTVVVTCTPVNGGVRYEIGLMDPHDPRRQGS
jgi:hypothetical protein